MPETILRPHLVEPQEVNLHFTRTLQSIAQEGWTAALEGIREPEVVARAFNPDNPVLITDAIRQYRDFARHGRLVVVRDEHGFDPVAYALARNDVSPSGPGLGDFAKRSLKRAMSSVHTNWDLPLPDKVYAWVKHEVAKPDAPKGAGTLALMQSLQGFPPDRTSTLYIDDENQESINYFLRLGYRWDTGDAKPVYRFGIENERSLQCRYTAQVGDVIDEAKVSLKVLGVTVATDY